MVGHLPIMCEGLGSILNNITTTKKKGTFFFTPFSPLLTSPFPCLPVQHNSRVVTDTCWPRSSSHFSLKPTFIFLSFPLQETAIVKVTKWPLPCQIQRSKPSPHLFIYFFISTRVWTQVLEIVWHVPCHFSHDPVLFGFNYFSDSYCFFCQTIILLTCTSLIAEITSIYHRAQS
jgi:hypothetical protein